MCQPWHGNLPQHVLPSLSVPLDRRVARSNARSAWAAELGGLDYPLLSDTDRALSRAYGVLDEKENVSLRATLIINASAVIAYQVASHVNVGRSVEETLRVLRALRTERLCPADWKPGEPTGDLGLKY